MARQLNSLYVTDYVFGSGIKERTPVATVSLTNINLSNNLLGATIGGYVVAAEDRVLLVGQSTSTENGVYVINSGAGATIRAEDYNIGENVSYTFLSVKLGTYASSDWISIAPTGTTGIVGTGDLNFKMIAKAPQSVGDINYVDTTRTIGTLSKPTVTSLLQMDSSGNPTWVNKSSITSGLDAKESVRFDTLLNVTTYNASGGTFGTGIFTNVNFTSTTIFNRGVKTINIGDRILVRNQTDAKQNGIYVVLTAGATGSMERTFDFYNSTTITGGAFTFVENTNVGWVLQGEGALTPNTDNLIWVQFSALTPLTAGNGIDITNNIISARLKNQGGIEFQNTNQLALNLQQNNITGILGVNNGGTGVNTLTSNAIILGNGTGAVNTLAPVNYKTLVVDGTTTYQLSNTIYATRVHDTNDYTMLTLSSVSEPDSYINITNAILNQNPIISASGQSSNMGIDFQGVGANYFSFLGTSTNSGTIRLYENSDNGSNYIGIKSPELLAGDTVFTLPQNAGTNGQILQTNGSGLLSWVNPRRDLVLTCDNILVNSNLNTSIAFFPYATARYGTANAAQLIFNFNKASANINIDVFNATANTVLATATITTSGINTLSFTTPSANAELRVRVQKIGVLASSSVAGITLNF